jgi:hypothetical protein
LTSAGQTATATEGENSHEFRYSDWLLTCPKRATPSRICLFPPGCHDFFQKIRVRFSPRISISDTAALLIAVSYGAGQVSRALSPAAVRPAWLSGKRQSQGTTIVYI